MVIIAEKRMFSNKVIGKDDFLEMPDSTQNLYFHLSMYADDDGFVDNWKTIMRMTGKKEDDLKILITKSFIIPFESGVLVIKDWRINNYIRSDRKTPTRYLEEMEQLVELENKSYELKNNECLPLAYQVSTTCLPNGSIDKISIDKNSIISHFENALDRDFTFQGGKKESLVKEINKDIELTSFKVEDVENNKPKISSGSRAEIIEIEPLLDAIRKLYVANEYGSRFDRTATRKKLVTILKSRDKNKKLYPLQVILAFSTYLKQSSDDGKEENYIKLASTFLTNQVYDYSEKVDNLFQKGMIDKYGEEWQKIKFEFKEK